MLSRLFLPKRCMVPGVIFFPILGETGYFLRVPLRITSSGQLSQRAFPWCKRRSILTSASCETKGMDKLYSHTIFKKEKNDTNNEFFSFLKREMKFQCNKFLQSFVLPQILQTRQSTDGKLARTVLWSFASHWCAQRLFQLQRWPLKINILTLRNTIIRGVQMVYIR